MTVLKLIGKLLRTSIEKKYSYTNFDEFTKTSQIFTQQNDQSSN